MKPARLLGRLGIFRISSARASVAWSAAAQLISSVTALLISIVAARALDATAFGSFAVLLAVVNISVGVCRALTLEPLVFKFSHSVDRVGYLVARDRALSLTGVVAAATCVPTAITGYVLGGTATAFASLFLTLVVIVQDHMRFALIAEGRHRRAVVHELVSIPLLLGGLVVVAAAPQLWVAVLAWVISAAVPALLGILVLKPRLHWKAPRAWLRTEWRDVRYFASDFLLTSGVSQIATILVSLLVGLGGAGAIRAAQLLLTPVTLVTRGVMVGLAAQLRAMALHGRVTRIRQIGLLFGLLASLAAGATVAVGFLVPREWLEEVLGDSTAGGLAVLPWAGVAAAFSGIAIGGSLVLRALGRVRDSFRTKLVSAPVTVAAVIAGALLAGASGAQAGIATGEASRSLLVWRTLRGATDTSSSES